VVAASAQAPFGDGVFEFGRERVFDGVIVEHPYAMLRIDGQPGHRYWLVGPGKRGAAALVAGLDGRTARVTGTLIEREGERMIQVSSGRIDVDRRAVPVRGAALVPDGPLALDGEIVDSKCHLGVMKPGDGPAHRDCAQRCLLGGVPPMLVVRAGGAVRRVPLVASDGSPLSLDLEPWVARPVRARGIRHVRNGEEYLAVGVDDLIVRD